MIITFPTNTKNIIDSIRNAIGRSVEFYIAEYTKCPSCELDIITNTSSDSFCPTCSGVGYLITYSGTVVNAHITWGFSEQVGWVSGGTLDEGDCRVQIEYSIVNRDLVENSDYVVVDGRKMEIKQPHYRGTPAINRILIDLLEREKE